jgi:hypothetical protein
MADFDPAKNNEHAKGSSLDAKTQPGRRIDDSPICHLLAVSRSLRAITACSGAAKGVRPWLGRLKRAGAGDHRGDGRETSDPDHDFSWVCFHRVRAASASK